LEEMDRDELIEKFSALQMKHSVAEEKKSSSPKSNTNGRNIPNGAETGFERFFINVGRKDNLQPGNLISLISEECRTGDINIGKIDIMGSFSFFEADLNYTDKILSAFQRKVKFQGRSVQVEVAKPKG